MVRKKSQVILATLLCLASFSCFLPNVGLSLLFGQQTPTIDNDEVADVLRFRRLYVPETRISDVIDGSYMPMTLERFDSMIQALELESAAGTTSQAAFQQATYHTRFDQGQLIDGRATLFRGNRSTRDLVPFEEQSLAISNPTWADLENRPANLFSVSGTGSFLESFENLPLRFDWTAQSDGDTRGPSSAGYRYDLQFIRAVVNELYIDLPIDFELLSDQAVLIEPTPVAPTIEFQSGGLKRVRIEIPRSGRIQFAVRPKETRIAETDIGRYRATNLAVLKESTVDCQNDIVLEVNDTWPSQIEFTIDRSTLIREVQVAGEPARFRVVEAPNELRSLFVELPSIENGHDLLVSIGSISSINGSEESEVPLIVPRNWSWLSERTTIRDSSDRLLELHRDSTQVLAAIERTNDPDTWDYVIQHTEPSTSILVQRDFRRPVITLEYATTINASGGELTATSHVRMDVNHGEHYEFSLRVPTDWAVRNISAFPLSDPQQEPIITVPIDLVEDWTTDEADEQWSQIRVRLSHPVVRGAPIRFAIATQRQRPSANEALNESDFQQIQFDGAVTIDAVLALAADAPYRFRFNGKEKCQLRSRESLPAFLENLMIRTPLDLMISFTGQAAQLEAFLEEQLTTVVETDISITAIVSAGMLTEEYIIRCDPGEAKIDHLEIGFSQSATEDLDWTLLNGDERSIRANRIEAPDVMTESSTAWPETWRVDLLVPQESSFELRAIRRRPLATATQIALAGVERSVSGQARLVLMARSECEPSIEVSNLQTIPRPLVDRRANQRVIGSYRYASDRAMESKLVVELEPRTDNQQTDYWILAQSVRTRLQNDLMTHRVRCLVETNGERVIRMTLPPNASLGDVSVSEGSVSVVESDLEDRLYLVEVSPTSGTSFELEVVWTRRFSVPWLADNVIVPDIDWHRPVLATKHELLLSGDYSTSLLGHDSTGDIAPSSLIVSRLFGCLLRDRASNAQTWQSIGINTAQKSWPIGTTVSSPSDGDAVAFTLYRTAAVRLLQYVCIVVAFLIGWILALQPRWWCCTVGLFAILVLVGPLSIVPFLSPFFIGLGFGGLFRWSIRLFVIDSASRDSSESQSTRITSVTATLLVIALGSLIVYRVFTLNDSATASQNEASEETSQVTSRTTSHGVNTWSTVKKPNRLVKGIAPSNRTSDFARVIVPIDEEGNVSQDLVYLPRDFYDRLLSAEQSTPDRQSSGRIASIDYRLRGDWGPIQNQERLVEVVARMQVSTTRRNARFEIPFDRNEVALIQDRLTLDGQRPAVERLLDDRLYIQIPDVGDHTIEVAFVPRMEEQLRPNEISFSIPECHRSVCRLELASSTPELEFPGARGAIRLDSLRSLYEVQLGGISRLSVQWQGEETDLADGGDRAQDRLYWMTFSQDGIMLEALATIRIPAEVRSTVVEIPFRMDPAWRLTVDDRNARILRAATQTDDGVIEIERPEDSNSVQLAFTLSREEFAGVGHIAPPQIRLGSNDSGRHWLAVSGDENVELNLEAMEGATAALIAEFVELWERRQSMQRNSPDQVFVVQEDRTQGIIQVRQPDISYSVAERNSIIVGNRSIELRYRANLSSQNGDLPFLQLNMPAAAEIQRVLLRANDEIQEVEWAPTKTGRLFIRGFDLSQQEFQIDIDAKVVANREQDLPFFSLNNPQSRRFLVEVFHREDIEIELDGPISLLELGSGQLVEGLGRRVCSQEFTNEMPDGSVLRVAESESLKDYVWQICNSVELTPEGWVGHIDVMVDIPDTTENEKVQRIDAIRLRIRNDWIGPFSIEPFHRIDYVPQTDRESGLLTIQPEFPWTSDVALRITGPLTSPVSVPNVELMGFDQTKGNRLAFLPRRLESDSLRWEVSGLKRATDEPPSILLSESRANDFASQPFDSYLVTESRFDAIIQSVDEIRSQPNIHTIDLHYFATVAGAVVGIAECELRSAGQQVSEVTLPPNAIIERLLVDGVDSEYSESGNGRWRIEVASTRLPQQIQLVFSGRPRDFISQSRKQLVVQGIDFPGIDVANRFWTFHQSEQDWNNLRRAGIPIDEVDYCLRRLDATIQVLERASNWILELDEIDRIRWFAHWDERFQVRRSRVQAIIDDHPDLFQDRSDRLQTLIVQHDLIAAQFGLATRTTDLENGGAEEVRNDAIIGNPVVDQLYESIITAPLRLNAQTEQTNSIADLLIASLGTEGAACYEGAHAELVISRDNRTNEDSNLSLRIATAFTIGTVCLLLTASYSRNWVRRQRRWIGVCGFLAIGLVWLNWLQPGWLGVVFLIAAFVVAAKFPDEK